LVYMGADNNLEDGLINDLDEFERAGGSTSSVRILALLDRTPDYDTSNGNWTDTRLFEPGPDTSDDYQTVYPPTLDTKPLGDLGEIDTSYPGNLLDFIVWGVKAYPAQHYAIILNDHGGAWYGTVQDETTGQGLLTIPGLSQTFDAALKNTGLKKFDLLINDACLMSGVEHYAAMSRYFDYAIGSPEITLNPSFDMTLLTQLLNKNPNMDIGQLGKQIADKYVTDMESISADTEPVLGADVTNLQQFGNVTDALNQFTDVVNSNPRAFVSLIGQARANTYAYSFFLPEDQYGPPTSIDVGDFMRRVSAATDDKQLKDAADNVDIALDSVRIYGAAGNQLSKFTSYYNIYFPQRSTDFDPSYVEQSPLQDWAQMLRTFYGGASPQSRAFRGPQGSAALAPSSIPVVNITNIYPEESTSIAEPITISMEVTGRNISQGKFTVDKIEADGTAVRLRTARIITNVVVDGVVQQLNQWNPGVDDSDFTWDAQLPLVSDGKTSSFEQVVTIGGVSSLAGRYRYPGSENWQAVTVMFDDNGNVDNVVSGSAGSNAVASIRIEAGGTFQTFRSEVTADGRVLQKDGTNFTWPEKGISWDYAPAPTGQYNLGFLIESAGGTTGFSSAKVNVDNDQVDKSLLGYVDADFGLVFQRPTGWYAVDYFPADDFLQTGSLDDKQYMVDYIGKDGVTDLKEIAQAVLDKYNFTSDDTFKKTKVGGLDALEFTFHYTNDTGDFTGHAFAVYREELGYGMVFSSEATDPANVESNYQLFLDHLEFFDATKVRAKDTGVWSSDSFTSETHFPVPTTWMPGAEDVKDSKWWYYHPNDDKTDPTFAAVEVYKSSDDDVASWLTDL
ncbi:MAG: clostripain-related cysteine peptidase, partial [Chloroflexota bacterium]